MSWEDRDYAGDDDPRRGFGRPGGDWQGIRPTLDNPMTWSLRFLHIAGITVRVHVIFLIFVVVELLRSLVGVRESEIPIPRELMVTAITMASLFLIVLLHELGRITESVDRLHQSFVSALVLSPRAIVRGQPLDCLGQSVARELKVNTDTTDVGCSDGHGPAIDPHLRAPGESPLPRPRTRAPPLLFYDQEPPTSSTPQRRRCSPDVGASNSPEDPRMPWLCRTW